MKRFGAAEVKKRFTSRPFTVILTELASYYSLTVTVGVAPALELFVMLQTSDAILSSPCVSSLLCPDATEVAGEASGLAADSR